MRGYTLLVQCCHRRSALLPSPLAIPVTRTENKHNKGVLLPYSLEDTCIMSEN